MFLDLSGSAIVAGVELITYSIFVGLIIAQDVLAKTLQLARLPVHHQDERGLSQAFAHRPIVSRADGFHNLQRLVRLGPKGHIQFDMRTFAMIRSPG